MSTTCSWFPQAEKVFDTEIWTCLMTEKYQCFNIANHLRAVLNDPLTSFHDLSDACEMFFFPMLSILMI